MIIELLNSNVASSSARHNKPRPFPQDGVTHQCFVSSTALSIFARWRCSTLLCGIQCDIFVPV